MNDLHPTLTYIGGPTLLIELDGLRLLTDPTFDPAGTDYPTRIYTLHKLSGPAVPLAALGKVDIVLLSHDHHYDNLDNAGRAMLQNVETVLTTPIGARRLAASLSPRNDAGVERPAAPLGPRNDAGAQRLGSPALGLEPWQSVDLPTPGGHWLRVTGTPARHGPADGDRGPVTGFILSLSETPDRSIYISGDTVWYEGVAEVSRNFPVKLAVLFMGAARVAEVGPDHLTFSADEAVEAAKAFPQAAIVPLHHEGWAHFSESRKQIDAAFIWAGLEKRLRWLEPGKATEIDW